MRQESGRSEKSAGARRGGWALRCAARRGAGGRGRGAGGVAPQPPADPPAPPPRAAVRRRPPPSLPQRPEPRVRLRCRCMPAGGGSFFCFGPFHHFCRRGSSRGGSISGKGVCVAAKGRTAMCSASATALDSRASITCAGDGRLGLFASRLAASPAILGRGAASQAVPPRLRCWGCVPSDLIRSGGCPAAIYSLKTPAATVERSISGPAVPAKAYKCLFRQPAPGLGRL